MKDLEKLRQNQEREYQLAVLENKIESAFPFFQERNIRILLVDHGDYISCNMDKNKYREFLTEEEAGYILQTFQPDDKVLSWRPSGTPCEYTDYYMVVDRSPSDPHTLLRIDWMHDNTRMSLRMPIYPSSPFVGCFKIKYRKLSESEISVYGIQKNRYTYDLRNSFPYYSFATGNVINYYGGHCQQIDDAVIKNIVDYLINTYNNNKNFE